MLAAANANCAAVADYRWLLLTAAVAIRKAL